jgi:hypothetical protein
MICSSSSRQLRLPKGTLGVTEIGAVSREPQIAITNDDQALQGRLPRLKRPKRKVRIGANANWAGILRLPILLVNRCVEVVEVAATPFGDRC